MKRLYYPLVPWLAALPLLVGCPSPEPSDEATPSLPPGDDESPTASPAPSPTPEPPTPTLEPATPTPEAPTPGYLGQETARAPLAEDQVLVEPVQVPAFHPPANPAPGKSDTGPAESPVAYDQATFLRYHYQGSSRPVEAILLCMPGFQGSAGDFDYTGRALVAAGEGRIEVWAVDRRSNQLEDHLGADAAEAVDEADTAFFTGLDYYFAGSPLEGQSFAGFQQNPDYPYLSEWGLKLALEDLNAIAQLVPQAWRNKVLFLAGHSLGGSMVQAYAAWDFDGDASSLEDAGYEQLAGLVLLDGGNDPNPERVTAQADYEQSVLELRDGTRNRTAAFTGLTVDVNVLLELFALAAVKDPSAEAPLASVYEYPGVNQDYLDLLFGGGRYTYRALLGVAVDDNFQPAYYFNASVGFLSAGPVKPYFPGAGDLYKPADQTGATLYGWRDYDEVTDEVDDAAVEEATHIDDLAYACHKGPANYTEWYFPSRLSTDLGLTSDLAIQGDGSDWRWNTYGMAAVHNAKVNIPVYAFFTDESGPASALSGYQLSLAQTLRDGTPRGEGGFEFVAIPGYEHLDVLMADMTAQARPNEVLTGLLPWLERFGLYGKGEGPLPGELTSQGRHQAARAAQAGERGEEGFGPTSGKSQH